MIRLLARVLAEAVILISLTLGAITLYIEYGPRILYHGKCEIQNSTGEFTCVELKVFRKIPRRAPALPPAIRLIPPSATQKG